MHISREAHAHRQHEVAYHALTAAMHAADDVGDAQALAEVEREARAQIDWIDHNVPDNRLSTASASKHQHPGVFALLARQAAAHVALQART
jgi:hypothetical protein